jgi:glc operon protein GlcG
MERKMSGKLTLEMALDILEKAQKAAEEMGVPPMAFAIVDAAGHLVALHNMDNGRWISPEIAQAKAVTSAAFRAPSGALGERMRENPFFVNAMSALTQGRFVASKGGLPIMMDDEVIGAIGASGGTGDQDEDVIRKALGG